MEPKLTDNYNGEPFMTIAYFPLINEVSISGYHNRAIAELGRPLVVEKVFFTIIDMNAKSVTV